MGDRPLVALIGLIAGMLVCCCSGGLILALGSGGAPVEVAQSAVPPNAPIEADIAESYLNRTFLQNAAGYPSPWPLRGGQLDVLPGNRIKFTAQLESPLGELTANGVVIIVARDGQLDIRIAEVRLGQLPVTALMQLFAPDIGAQVSAQANQQLRERTALAGVQLVGVASDDTQLRFFLAAK